MSLRVDFIEAPLVDVLQQGFSAANCNSSHGIETHPVLEYILQSIFLRMTGFSEQKLRAIHWYIVNVDLDQRYKILKGGSDASKFGEYSNLKDKQTFYNWMKKQVQDATKIDIELTPASKTAILNRVKNQLNLLTINSIFAESYSKDIKAAQAFLNTIATNHFAQNKELLTTPVKSVYENLYKQRNRSAHNSLSYQQDIDTLQNLLDPNRQECNYFTYYAILLLLDEIFVDLYRQMKVAYEATF